MFRSIVQNLTSSRRNEGHDLESYARTYDRREEDMCVLSINGNLHPVQNWSIGGAYVSADSHYFEVNQDVKCILQLKTQNSIKRIAVEATIIRKDNEGIAISFDSMNDVAQTQMLEYLEQAVA